MSNFASFTGETRSVNGSWVPAKVISVVHLLPGLVFQPILSISSMSAIINPRNCVCALPHTSSFPKGYFGALEIESIGIRLVNYMIIIMGRSSTSRQEHFYVKSSPRLKGWACLKRVYSSLHGMSFDPAWTLFGEETSSLKIHNFMRRL